MCNRAAAVVGAALTKVGLVVEYTPSYEIFKVVGLEASSTGRPSLDIPLQEGLPYANVIRFALVEKTASVRAKSAAKRSAS